MIKIYIHSAFMLHVSAKQGQLQVTQFLEDSTALCFGQIVFIKALRCCHHYFLEF
jgi:hypothetical protein